MIKYFHYLAVAAAAVGLANLASAQIPYGDSGAYNNADYTFLAPTTGTIQAYFAGSGASYDEQVGLYINGVFTGTYGLDNKSSTVGQEFDLGSVQAGDVLVFADDVTSIGKTVFSNPAWNLGYDNGPAVGTTDGHNHVYSVLATAGEAYTASPAGTYVGFEDLPFPGSDYNYFDDTFVFTDNGQALITSAPDATSTLLLAAFGLAGLVAASRFRRAVI